MGIDAATRRNLELTEPLRFDGSKKNTLLYVLDKTETAMGGRLLRKWIERPLQIEEQINERLDAVEAISDAAREREVLAAALSDVYDIAAELHTERSPQKTVFHCAQRLLHCP